MLSSLGTVPYFYLYCRVPGVSIKIHCPSPDKGDTPRTFSLLYLLNHDFYHMGQNKRHFTKAEWVWHATIYRYQVISRSEEDKHYNEYPSFELKTSGDHINTLPYLQNIRLQLEGIYSGISMPILVSIGPVLHAILQVSNTKNTASLAAAAGGMQLMV